MPRLLQTLARIFGTLLIVAGIAAFYFFIFNQANSTTIAMTFLLATLGVATWWGLPEAIVASIAGMLCFFNEKVDLELDGELEQRPASPWSDGAKSGAVNAPPAQTRG